jgi:hypothetical protein
VLIRILPALDRLAINLRDAHRNRAGTGAGRKATRTSFRATGASDHSGYSRRTRSFANSRANRLISSTRSGASFFGHRPLNSELESLWGRACVSDGPGQNVTKSGRMNV